MIKDTCQVPECGRLAEFHSFPANAVSPDENGMLTCASHLSEGMSYALGQPEPEQWLVFPIK